MRHESQKHDKVMILKPITIKLQHDNTSEAHARQLGLAIRVNGSCQCQFRVGLQMY